MLMPLMLLTAAASVALVPGSRVGKCGIAVDVGKCQESWQYLARFGDVSHINCMGYGGPSDSCTLNIPNDQPDAGVSKDPSRCNNGILVLWDEPETQGRDAQWAAQTWMLYASHWSSQLRQQRSDGMKVTTPMFNIVDSIHTFFSNCPSCADPNSPAYIDIIIWNAWITPDHSEQDEVNWIKDRSAQLKLAYGGRQVWLGNYAYLGMDATAQRQIDIIKYSGIFDANSGIDSVYYFAAFDYGDKIPAGTNSLSAASGGTTIGQELMRKCVGGAPSPSPSPTPSPIPSTGCCPTPDGVMLGCCTDGIGCCPTADGEMLGCCSSTQLNVTLV